MDGQVRVLLVDDSLVFLNTLQKFLRGFHDLMIVGVAHDGKEALSLLPAAQPDVVLLDLMMPGVSGLEIIPDLRAAQPDVSVVVLSLLGFRDVALSLGADEYVFKPELAHDLMPALQRVMQGYSARTDLRGEIGSN
jgi:DNA-binding NarL/FixJ family response regulator